MRLPTIIQKPCIRKCLSFEGEQQKIEHDGSRRKFSAAYISMIWPEEKLIYDWKRLILIWDNASYHVSKIMLDYINAQRDWLTVIHLPKKAPYLNPNERRINQQIKSDVCANRFYNHIEELKDRVSEYLDKRFGRWYDDIRYDT